VELGGRAIRVWMERADARAGTVVWRRCSRVAFIGWGWLAGVTEERSRRRPVELQWRKRFRWGRKWGGETGSRGDEQGAVLIHFAMGGEGVQHGGGEPSAAPGRASGGRRRLGSLTGWAHLSVRGRRRADWAGKGGRSWAAVGLEKKGGGWTETIAWAEIQKSKRKSILIDFWIKIGLEIE
jgi:hypothetical protein